MAGYINEEYYDMIMAHGECQGQYTLMQEDTRNYIYSKLSVGQRYTCNSTTIIRDRKRLTDKKGLR